MGIKSSVSESDKQYKKQGLLIKEQITLKRKKFTIFSFYSQAGGFRVGTVWSCDNGVQLQIISRFASGSPLSGIVGWLFGFYFFLFSSVASAYVSINVGKAYVRESQIAIQPLVLFSASPASKEKKTADSNQDSLSKSSSDLWGEKVSSVNCFYEKEQNCPPLSPELQSALRVGAIIFNIMRENLSFSGSFKLMDQEVFLEQPGEQAFEPYTEDPNGFIWKNWQLLNTDYLVLSGYSVTKGTVYMDLYLYHVPLRRKILQKRYIANRAIVKKIAHKICNDIVEVLTKKPGIFLTKIAAVRSMGGKKKELFIMNWNGKNKKQSSFHHTALLSPVWSRDGRYVAYTAFLYRKSKKKRIGSLILYDRFKRNRWVVSKREQTHLGSDFLFDGKHILVSLFLGKGNMDIAKMSLKDGSVSPITFGPSGSINVEPVVHPEGKNIVFSSDRGGKVMIYSMNIKGKNIQPLSWNGSYNSTPDYSPDGKQVVFSGFNKGHFDIFIMNADGSNLRLLTSAKTVNNKGANNESPSFSPDGRYIVFTGNQTGNYQLYVMNVLTLRVTQITFDSHNYKSPRWSPFLQ